MMESAEEAKRVHGETVALDGAAHGRGKFGVTIRVPCGVVVAISPFNFPLNLVCHKVGPALAGGNAVVLKPATDTPLSALRLTEILLEAGLPPEGLNTLTGSGGEIGDLLGADRPVREITLTRRPDGGGRICKTAGLQTRAIEGRRGERRAPGHRRAAAGCLVRADDRRRREAGDADLVRRAVRPGGRRHAVQRHRRGDRARERHELRAGGGDLHGEPRVGVEVRARGPVGQPPHQLGAPVAGRPDALRRPQGVRVRQGGPGVRNQRDDGAQDGRVPPLVLRRRGPNERSPGMADGRLCWLPATELATLIRRKKVSPVEVVDAILDRIERINPKLNAFVTLTDEAARREAKAAERALMRRSTLLGPLHGVPFSVKDLVVTKGVRTTFGTPLYRDNVPTEDAPMVERMKRAGAILLGKTNTPTFGWIGATHNLLFGPTRNPWDLERTPGGSSGGASAAAAAGLGPLHIGTDGGGSIRIPASFAGIFGLKASYGRIPAYPPSGAWSLSHIGPMTRTVAPRWPSPRDCWEQTFCGGIATRMAPYIDRREEIEPGLYRIIEATLRNPPTRYVQAWFDRLAWWQHPRAFFETYDLLVTPTIACPPFPIGLDNPTEIAGKRIVEIGRAHV